MERKPKKRNQSHERDKVRRPAVRHIRSQIMMGQLNRYPFLYWTCPPDPGKQKAQVVRRMVLDGYEKGNYDMTIVAASDQELVVWLIEFKYGSNTFTPEQKLVSEKAAPTLVNTLKIKTIEEFEDFVKKNLK